MSGFKKCEVCGGRVSLLDEQSNFGYCERCGIVYALDKLRERRAEEGTEELGNESTKQRKREESQDVGPGDSDRKAEFAAFRWRCPDCDAELTANDETDLSFLKREHVRELHPNRPTA